MLLFISFNKYHSSTYLFYVVYLGRGGIVHFMVSIWRLEDNLWELVLEIYVGPRH